MKRQSHYILTSEKNNDYDTKVSVAHSKHIYSQIRFIVSQLERKKLTISVLKQEACMKSYKILLASNNM